MVSSIQNLIENFLEKNQDKPIINQKKGYRTFNVTGKELKDKINKTRIFLAKNNIKKTDKIIIFGSNSIEWIIIYFSCILSGIIVVPLDIMTDLTLFKKIQKQVKAKAIFQNKNLPSIGSKKFYLENLDDLINLPSSKIPKIKISSKDILEIIYTSGTTSEPKGVILTNENLAFGLNSAIESIPLKIKIKVLNLLPLSHIFSQVYGLFFLMYFNDEIFFIDSIQTKKIISFIKNKSINGVILVPGILTSLKKQLTGKSVLLNLGIQFRLIGVGGTSLDVELEKWWKKHLITIIQGYGLTETSSVVSGNKIISKTGSVGKIAKDVEVKLAKDNEILVKGKNIFSGYYEDKEKTKQAFENNWFKTGDIGIIKNNYLYIKERKKDIIITSSGLNVYPIDIENVLKKMPEVKESCVLEKDNKIYAVLILNENTNKKTNLTNLITNANKKLLEHQKITGYSLWADKNFPKTLLGKIKKYQVLEKLKEIEKTEKQKDFSYENRLYNTINKILKPSQKINSKSKLSDLGMDSLKRVELISEIELAFDTEIDETKITQYTNINDLQKIMKEKYITKVRFKKWPLNFLSKFIRLIINQILIYPLMKLFVKTEYSGLENLKLISKPVIFVSNHQSVLDTPVINKNLEKQGFKISIAADSNYIFGIGTIGLLLKFYRKSRGFFVALLSNSYPFGETIGTNISLEFTGEMLDRNYSILIFPEAHRTTDGKIKEFKSGIGYLALNMKVPIIPIKIEGLFEIMPAERIIPKFGKAKVKIGKPINLEKLEKSSYISATKLIEKKVREL